MVWDSTNLGIPLAEFAALFGLTERELRREGVSGRLAAVGIPEPGISPARWAQIEIREQAAKAWVRDKGLPPPICAKVKRAGGLDALQRWRDDYFSRMQLDLAGDAIILPDGSRVEHPRFRKVTEH